MEREVALPTETTARARALLTRLIAEYSYKGSAHPLQSGPAVDDVFLLDLPLTPPVAPGPKATENGKPAAAPKAHTVVAGWSFQTALPPTPARTPGRAIPEASWR